MKEYFLIYLFTSVEKIADLLSLFWLIALLSLFFALASLLVLPSIPAITEREKRVQDSSPKIFKWSVAVLIISTLLGAIGNLLPDKKDLALILAGGATYKVITSPEAKEVGGKALGVLNKKLDEYLEE